MDLFTADQVLDSCSFRDEDDDCTYHYTVENPKDKDLEVQVLKKRGERHVFSWEFKVFIKSYKF